MTINEKIAKIREVFCENDNKKFAALIGQSTQYASNICKNGKSVGDGMKQQLLEIFPQISKAWLLADEGEMLKIDAESKNTEVVSMPREVFEQITRLTETIKVQQETILLQQSTINTLAETNKKMVVQTTDNAICAAAK